MVILDSGLLFGPPCRYMRPQLRKNWRFEGSDVLPLWHDAKIYLNNFGSDLPYCLNSTKLGQLIVGKVVEIVATRRLILRKNAPRPPSWI